MDWRQYHQAAKHSAEQLRNSAVALDWERFPSPYREYEGVPVVDLPANPVFPEIAAWDVLRGHCGIAGRPPGGASFLSALLYYSASLSAVKTTAAGVRYGLRVNPSSGNLHPTEIHFATSGLADWPDGLYHYRPRTHMAERRGTGDFGLPGRVMFILTSVAWREAWKYGDRGYRYCLLDAGHLAESITLAARAMGEVAAVTTTSDRRGLPDDEWPLLMVSVGTAKRGREFVLQGGTCEPYPGVTATVRQMLDSNDDWQSEQTAASESTVGGRLFGETVRARRSALDFVGGDRNMSFAQLAALLSLTRGTVYLFVHRVDGLSPGLYKYSESGELECVRTGDQRVVAAGLCLRQDLAGNACVALSITSNWERGYRAAHFEAGAMGQRLYIGAEALGLQATGIGAFFDDRTREYFGADDEPVYHFAIGYAVPDARLTG